MRFVVELVSSAAIGLGLAYAACFVLDLQGEFERLAATKAKQDRQAEALQSQIECVLLAEGLTPEQVQQVQGRKK